MTEDEIRRRLEEVNTSEAMTESPEEEATARRQRFSMRLMVITAIVIVGWMALLALPFIIVATRR